MVDESHKCKEERNIFESTSQSSHKSYEGHWSWKNPFKHFWAVALNLAFCKTKQARIQRRFFYIYQALDQEPYVGN